MQATVVCQEIKSVYDFVIIRNGDTGIRLINYTPKIIHFKPRPFFVWWGRGINDSGSKNFCALCVLRYCAMHYVSTIARNRTNEEAVRLVFDCTRQKKHRKATIRDDSPIVPTADCNDHQHHGTP